MFPNAEARPTSSTNRGLLGIFLGNGMTMGAALIFTWDLGDVLWIYWGQSVIIGISNVFRMMKLRTFSTAGMKSNGNPVPETEAGKRTSVLFFIVHYGFFHLGYLAFVSERRSLEDFSGWGLLSVALCIASFAWSHARSLLLNQEEDFRDKKPHLGTLMLYPYLRILPMHTLMLFGAAMGADAFLVVLFLALKTAADVGMHKVEHKLFRGLPSVSPTSA